MIHCVRKDGPPFSFPSLPVPPPLLTQSLCLGTSPLVSVRGGPVRGLYRRAGLARYVDDALRPSSMCRFSLTGVFFEGRSLLVCARVVRAVMQQVSG